MRVLIICILPGSGARKTRFSPFKDEETLEAVKLSDLARETRVSTATVSRFVSARGGITPQTCDRIIDAAASLGFDVERGRKSRIIAFVLSNRHALHPFHSAVLLGAHAIARNDYAMLFLPFHYPTGAGASKVRVPEVLLHRKIVSGVIVAGTKFAGCARTAHGQGNTLGGVRKQGNRGRRRRVERP
jgi:hypothetical protein